MWKQVAALALLCLAHGSTVWAGGYSGENLDSNDGRNHTDRRLISNLPAGSTLQLGRRVVILPGTNSVEIGTHQTSVAVVAPRKDLQSRWVLDGSSTYVVLPREQVVAGSTTNVLGTPQNYYYSLLLQNQQDPNVILGISCYAVVIYSRNSFSSNRACEVDDLRARGFVIPDAPTLQR